MNKRPLLRGRDDGFVMVALLVGISVAAVWMTALLPAWRQQALRQKEDDLVFRGEQYARAIMLFRCKTQSWPPNIDILVSQKYLRKKWKDPITNSDFDLVPAPAQGQGQPQSSPGRAGTTPAVQAPGASGGLPTGIYGVRSKSPATSIKVYTQQTSYNLWRFDFQDAMGRSPGSYCQQANQQNQPGRGNQPGAKPGDGRTGPAQPGIGGPGRAGPGGTLPPGAPVPPPPPIRRGGGGL